MSVQISLEEFKNKFAPLENGDTGLSAAFKKAKKEYPHIDVREETKKIPQQYLENLTSLGLAVSKGSTYTINQDAITALTQKFAPELKFDSNEKSDHQLGSLTPYLFKLFELQYEKIKEICPDKYLAFKTAWEEFSPTTIEKFPQFLDRLTNNGKAPLEKDFFDSSLAAENISLENSNQPVVHVNFIPGKDRAVIQYYTFYPTNDQNRFFRAVAKIALFFSKLFPSLAPYKSAGFHLGDWEEVDVYVEKQGEDFEAFAMTYIAHGKSNIHKTKSLSNQVFVIDGGHGTRPPTAFKIDLMFDNCDGKKTLSPEQYTLAPISLHNILLDDARLDIKCLKAIRKHGPNGAPDSALQQRSYAPNPSLLEYLRLHPDNRPKQPILGPLWNWRHPIRPNPRVPAWDPSVKET